MPWNAPGVRGSSTEGAWHWHKVKENPQAYPEQSGTTEPPKQHGYDLVYIWPDPMATLNRNFNLCA